MAVCECLVILDERGNILAHTTPFCHAGSERLFERLRHAVQEAHRLGADHPRMRWDDLEVALSRLQGRREHYVARLRTIGEARSPDFARLTSRQREVAQEAAMGATSVEIAETLSISTHTVRQHLKEVYRRLEVHNRLQLKEALESVAGPRR